MSSDRPCLFLITVLAVAQLMLFIVVPTAASFTAKRAFVSALSIRTHLPSRRAKRQLSSLMTLKRLPVPDKDGNDVVYTVADHFPPTSEFDSTVVYPALIVSAKETSSIRKQLGKLVLRKPKTRSVYSLEDDEQKEGRDERKIVLNLPDDPQNGNSQMNKEDPNNTTFDAIFQTQVLQDLVQQEQEQYRRSTMPLTQSYDDLTVDQVLAKILPIPVEEISSSFEQVGHLAHLNLPSEILAYKYIIGKVILDKNQPRITTVVNKIGTIQNEFRTFPMEIIASDSSTHDNHNTDNDSVYHVNLKEGGCTFHLNFKTVYWNSRLQQEHNRLVNLIASEGQSTGDRNGDLGKRGTKRKNPNQQLLTEANKQDDSASKSSTTIARPKTIVADIMAGVGPFAVPLTTRHKSQHEHVIVHANDLNPESFKYLLQNAKVNKCAPDRLISYNMDGRAFIHAVNANPDIPYVDHIIMNLPAIATEFLDAFRGWTKPSSSSTTSGGVASDCEKQQQTLLPTVHVHCFEVKDVDEARQNVIDRCEAALGCTLPSDSLSIHLVRDVSPKKNMLCVTFPLPAAVSGLSPISLSVNA
jgi:tRNA (guanine37-N1)-methyltransferase